MVRPKTSGRCVGVQRCSKILYEMLSRKLVLAVQKAASASIYNRQTTLAELTTAQSVILAIMNSILTEDFEFCGILIKLYSSVEQLRSSYLTVWLRDDFDFQEEDVSKVLMTVARLVNGGILDLPDHVLRVFRGLAAKYHVVDKCQLEKDFETIKFLVGESDEVCTVIKESTDISEKKKGNDTICPKIIVDSCEQKKAYCGEELPKKFVLKNINFKEVSESTKNYSIAKSSSDTNIIGRGTRNRRKATLSMFIDEKEESASMHPAGIQYKSGSVADIATGRVTPVPRARKSNFDRYRNAISKKEENAVSEISHSGKRTEVGADSKYSYNISKSSSAFNLRSNIADIISEESADIDVTDDKKPFYNIYKSSSARCLPSHIAEKATTSNLPSDPVSLFSGIMNYQIDGLQALIDHDQADGDFKNKSDDNDKGRTKQKENIISYIKEGVQSLVINSALPGFSFLKSILNINSNGLIDKFLTTQKSKIFYLEKETDDDEDFHDCNSWMSLHDAAWNGDLKEIEDHLNKGLDIELSDEMDRKPLHQASSNGQLEAVELLLQSGANPSATDRHQKTPLHLSLRSGNVEVCNVLLKNGADVNHRDYIGRTALHHAVDGGSNELISLLITFGADPNAEDNHGWTPLHRASETGQVSAVDVLLIHRANAMSKDNNGRTALHVAADRGRLEVVELLLGQNRGIISPKDLWGKTPLHLAASGGHHAVVRILLSKGFDVEEKDILGLTALHEAVEGGHLELVQYLISQRSDVSSVDNYGRTPLHRAVSTNQPAIVKTLLDEGADNVARDYLGQTPLHYAMKSSSKEIISLLIEHGADMTLTDRRHKTPLHVAAINGNKDNVCLLLEYGAKSDVQDNLGRTPLHEAAAYGHLDVIETLIRHGANVEEVDDLWKTSLHLAAIRGNLEIVKLLVKSGACVNSRSLLEATPLASALSDGQTAIAKFLRIVGGIE